MKRPVPKKASSKFEGKSETRISVQV